MTPEPTKVLTIAGSDSGGAAGLQADLKTMTVLGAYGMSVVTVVTAQNSAVVAGAHFLPAAFVGQQIDAVLSDYGAAAVKTGFLGRADIIETVAGRLAAVPWRVIDPVLVNHRGEAMFATAVVDGYRRELLPLATIITPNRAEAALLLDRPVDDLAAMRAAAVDLLDRGPAAVLITGGVDGTDSVDMLAGPAGVVELRAPRLDTANTHGSGDCLSAALAVFLAQGRPLADAVDQARAFTHQAIRAAAAWRLGAGHGPLAYAP